MNMSKLVLGGIMTSEQQATVETLTQQLLDRVAGVPAGLAVESLARTLFEVLMSVLEDRADYDRYAALLPTAAKRIADDYWNQVRAEDAVPLEPAERMQ